MPFRNILALKRHMFRDSHVTSLTSNFPIMS